MWIFDEEFETVINLNEVRAIYIDHIDKYEVIAEFDAQEKYLLKSFKSQKDAIDFIKGLVNEMNGE